MSPTHEAAGTVAIKAANAATYGGSGAAVVFGLTPSEWQVVGVIGGLVIALLGLIAGFLLSWYYKHQHLKIAKKRLEDGDE